MKETNVQANELTTMDRGHAEVAAANFENLRVIQLAADIPVPRLRVGGRQAREIARVSLTDFSLEGPQRRNLRRVWRKAVDEGCSFEIVNEPDLHAILPHLRQVSDEWVKEKRTREKRFSLGSFDEAFIPRSAVGVVKRQGEIVAFVTLWRSGQHAEVESDLMRYTTTAPSGIMRYALIEATFWASREGYAWFNLGAAPPSGRRFSPTSRR